MSASRDEDALAPIHPAHVRYIKLGEGGRWERECLRDGIIRLGFGTARPDWFARCQAGAWEAVAAAWVAERRGKGTATNFTHQVRAFFEDDGNTLWLTFIGEQMYWGLLTPTPPAPHPDAGGTFRTVVGGWRSTDLRGELLTSDRLSGRLTRLAMFRGTSCNLHGSVKEYAIRRINGQAIPEVEEARAVKQSMVVAIKALLRLLEPQDFELLVDLVFSASGWRRLGVVGKTTKTLDIDILLPSTGERAFVQVKSATTQAELDSYIQQFVALDVYDRMFYVFHSPDLDRSLSTDNERVTVIGAEKLAAMVLDAGLVDWLIRKVT
ncbi:MAG TPA: hypothetical protein VFW17_20965 [Ktedonobacterales bacterium]|nr:hypothetical protein [Ktedonobacterales bacterium]